MTKIVELTSTPYGISVKLENGVCFQIATNETYLNISFGFIKDQIVPEQQAANVVNINYTANKRS